MAKHAIETSWLKVSLTRLETQEVLMQRVHLENLQPLITWKHCVCVINICHRNTHFKIRVVDRFIYECTSDSGDIYIKIMLQCNL